MDTLQVHAVSGATMTRDEINREMARLRAVSSRGHKFITLVLKDMKKRNAIAGIEAVNATPFTNDEKGGVQDFYIEIKGGMLQFDFDMGIGEHVAKMLDTKHNRAFLASHYYGRIEKDGSKHKFWEIADEKIDAEIKAMADDIPKTMIKTNQPEQVKPEQVKQEEPDKKEGFFGRLLPKTTAVDTTQPGLPIVAPIRMNTP